MAATKDRLSIQVLLEPERAVLTCSAGLLIAACYAFAIGMIDLKHAGTLMGGLPIVAVFIAACASAVAGFAFSGICGALLMFLVDSPTELLLVLLNCSIANQTLSVAMLWRSIRLRRLLPFLVSGVAGSPVGTWMLSHCDPKAYVQTFGGGLAAYCLFTMVYRPKPAPKDSVRSRLAILGDIASGFAGGFLSGFAAFPGAPVALWLQGSSLDKTAQRAVYQPFILVVQFVSLATLGRQPLGMLDPLALLCMPVSLLGTWCGMRLFLRMTDRQFANAVTALLGTAGLAMMLH